MAATTHLPQTILNYITTNTYPDSDSLASATLTPTDLSTLLTSLQQAQTTAKDRIRTLSRSTAPSIDAWITRARDLHLAIQASQATAREIVSAAETTTQLRADVEDKRSQVDLLKREVLFNELLTGTLEHVRYADGLLQKAQEAAVRVDVRAALGLLEDAEASVAGLEGIREARVVGVLGAKAERLREGLVKIATEQWERLVRVDGEGKRVVVQKEGVGPAGKLLTLEAIVEGLMGLGVFETLVQKLAREVDRAVLRPRMVVDENEQVAKVQVAGSELSCATKTSDLDAKSLFTDLQSILSFMSTNLPQAVAKPLSTHLIPALTSRLEIHWLDPAIPLDISEMNSFQSLLDSVSGLSDQIKILGWDGTDALQEWVENAPRSWLTKQREAVLGEVRDWVFKGLRERKTVERVETRMVKREDVGLSQGGDGGDNWDDAWDEEDSKPKPAPKKNAEPDDVDEDASAWDLDEDEVSESKEGSSTDGGEEDDAWGWGDEETSKKPSSPVATKNEPQRPPTQSSPEPTEQELTLRETFTTTAIPSAVLNILQSNISDAETLSGPSFADSLIAPAASALYTLPTLALAIYRATAPTAYSKDAAGLGGMLIYNDVSWLADQLRAWKASQPASSKLRIDNDANALDQFAKKAYAAEMDAQRTILRDLLDGAQGFSNCTVQPFKHEAESAVAAAVDRVHTVRQTWTPVLAQSALLQSLGNLLAAVTGKMITEIQDLADISEPESLQLKVLCDQVSALKSAFVQRNPAQASSDSEDVEGQDMTFIYCPSWLKFQYLAEILEGSLADIKWMWKEGELSLEFGAEEVVGLVEALFAESSLRREAVREIRSGGRRG